MTGIRPYQYYDFTVSLCSTCKRRVDAKIYFQNECVWLQKRCPQHGLHKVKLADDIDYYKSAREFFIKPSEMPDVFQTAIEHGCPHDCGLCPDHEQHSCVTLIEVGERCDLSCPVCFAQSGPKVGGFHPLSKIERMLDAAVASEGEPDIVQISGGEPTIHPQFFSILDAAKQRPIRHLMVNTNGMRIARDAAFAERMAGYKPGFEIYLQFDSFEEGALNTLRGEDLRESRMQAIERLNELEISTTLVVTLAAGVNDHEIGRIIDFGLQQPAVRGVTFQPMQAAGRTNLPEPEALTLTGVRNRILEQSTVFQPEDIMPVPCHPDCIAMAYALKTAQGPVALTGMIDPKILLEGGRNTISFERDLDLREKLFAALSTGHSPESGAQSFSELLCCLPKVELPAAVDYSDLFRVIIMRFQDATDFDVRSIKKSCVHVVHPHDFRMIPLETYNLFYRQQVMEPLTV